MGEINKLKNRVIELEMKAEGKCPECKQIVKGWKPVFGSFAPEWWESCRECGIDPATGHLLSCSNKSLKIN